ncbi:hypothetical protein [Bacillus sp. AFS041924]|uniref:hypothetical protein n=1 Tax=Bacillus sp. AFS041924 TaxID=2033503 RepID=UPI000BFC2381|nr:hypothetical protein [Bacillus sp. AFS041924]PGS46519.1 hypothetical protein COC46_20940 [Bacillus sp. AFS041924]
MKKDLFVKFLGVILIFIILVTWFYPYSFFSFNKSITYDEDNLVIKDYLKEIDDFKKYYNSQTKEDLTNNRTQFILQMYEQDWLISKKPIKIKYQDLDKILLEVKESRQIMMDLAFQETYSKDSKEFLKYAIESCITIENSIEELKHSKYHSRKTINRQFRNIHRSIIGNFDLFVTFYTRR